MTKHHPLTAEEIGAYRPNPEILRYIQMERPAGAVLRVLDWGCGRGRLVACLAEGGSDAYGVDLDPEVIANGNAYFAAAPGKGEPRLRCLDPSGRAPFPDGFFDVIVSDNVLEHVADLDSALAEISRLTRPGGRGFHLFPARFTLYEGHLAMPIIHWLPKGALRWIAVRAFTVAGFEPHWEELVSVSRREKARVYFEYSRDKTFYRAPGCILQASAKKGFSARLVGLDHPRLAFLTRVPGLRSGPLRQTADRLLANLKVVELFLRKPMPPHAP